MININSKYIILFLVLINSINAFGKSVVNIQNWTTERGTRVLFTEAHELPMIDINVIFYAGSARDGKSFGLAAFTKAMLKEGTKSLTADQIADKFDQVGANFSASVDNDTATVSLRCLTDLKILNSALQVFISVLTEPVFPKREFSRVQKQMLTLMQHQQQNPQYVAFEKFLKNIYGDFPYNHLASGTPETVITIKPNDLLKFYRTYYTAKNAIVVIVGDVTRKQAEGIVNIITAKLSDGAIIDQLPTVIKKSKAETLNINFPATQTNIVMGQIGIARDNVDYLPLAVGNDILGGAAFVSELFRKVREDRGLVYAIHSDFYLWQKPGPFMIFFGASNENAQEAINITARTLKHFVQNGPTNKQLVAAKSSLIGQFPLKFSSNAYIARELGVIGIYNLPLDYFDTYVDKIKDVTLGQIREAFKRHINLDTMTIVAAGKSKH